MLLGIMIKQIEEWPRPVLYKPTQSVSLSSATSTVTKELPSTHLQLVFFLRHSSSLRPPYSPQGEGPGCRLQSPTLTQGRRLSSGVTSGGTQLKMPEPTKKGMSDAAQATRRNSEYTHVYHEIKNLHKVLRKLSLCLRVRCSTAIK